MYHIPSELENKVRLIIITSLITGEKTFKELKELTQATDGNLSIQLKQLQNTNYILCRKDFYKNKPRSTYRLTNYGENQFREYVSYLESFLKS